MGKKSPASSAQPRLTFAKDEARLAWLSLLLEMYHTTDQGVAQGIRQGERHGRTLACARGCAACCRSHGDIPVYPLELAGIAWFATEQLSGDLRETVRQQLARHKALPSCPFLVNEACTIHPLRPMACRHFNVFDRACAEGEDAFHTRRDDVLTPVAFYKNKALAMMLRHHQVPGETERKARVEDGSVHALAQSLRELRWENLALRMAR
ncbi:MAG TPA: YkgJ family cysteine cluster protein [Burkholderiales bacterium]|nr:YkgJ family cysteine cluster protein [Burkholderiales bacterium]